MSEPYPPLESLTTPTLFRNGAPQMSHAAIQTAQPHLTSPPPLPTLTIPQVLAWSRNPLKMMHRLFVDDVDRVVIHFGPRHAIISANPDDAETMLVKQRRSFDKSGFGYDALRELLGTGLVTSDGDFWKRQRRIANPAFHRRRLEGFATTMARSAESTLDNGWRSAAAASHSVDVGAEMMSLTLDIVTRTLLSMDVAGEASNVAKAIHSCLRYITKKVRAPLGPSLVDRVRFRRARADLDRIVLTAIAARRRGEEADDLLQMLMDARDEDGQGMTDQQLRDEVLTMFLAGHETTAMALTWTLSLLAQNPAIQDGVAREAQDVLGARQATFADFGKLELTRRALMEGMRLYPPIFMVARKVKSPVTLGPGHKVPAGYQMGVSPYAVHHNPAHWPNPERFDPDRFLPEAQKARHKMAYMPFSAGQRKCIGDQFALVEGTLVLATLLRELAVAPTGPRVAPVPSLTLRPARPLKLRLTRR